MAETKLPDPARPEREPYEPPAIETDEEFERLVLQCCSAGGPGKGGDPIPDETVAS